MIDDRSGIRDSDGARPLLRHVVATIAYRAGTATRGAPDGFADFRPGPTSRSAGEILAHVDDLLDWSLSLVSGAETWHGAKDVAWADATRRMFAALEALDAFLASGAPLACTPERLFQGPLADSLTHVGQLSMLRRLSGAPVTGEDYSRADIASGRVGADQPAPRAEFR